MVACYPFLAGAFFSLTQACGVIARGEERIHVTDQPAGTAPVDFESAESPAAIPACISTRAYEWLGSTLPPMHLVSRADGTVRYAVENTYRMTFNQATPVIPGLGTADTRHIDEDALNAFARDDVAAMTGAMLAAAAAAIGASPLMAPVLDPYVVSGTGRTGAWDFLCTACGGSTEIACPDCQGTLQVACVACLRRGRVTCAKCLGKGTLFQPCQVCYGSKGRYTTETSYASQPPQTIQQWTPCAGCGGTGGTSLPCYHCQYGTLQCAACVGLGTTACHRCGQTGRVPCRVCFAGHMHRLYTPHVVIAHSTACVPMEHSGEAHEQLSRLTMERVGALSHCDGLDAFEQADGVLTRAHRVVLPFVRCALHVGDRDYPVLLSADLNEVLDFGGLGDALLKTPPEGRGPQEDLPGVFAWAGSPLHHTAIEALVAPIRRAIFLPGHAASPALVEALLGRTQHFVTARFAHALVQAVAAQMRRLLLQTHGIGLLATAVVLLALAREKQWIELPDGFVFTDLVALCAVAALCLASDVVFLARLTRRVRRGAAPGSERGVVRALVYKNPARWACVAVYPIVFLLFLYLHSSR